MRQRSLRNIKFPPFVSTTRVYYFLLRQFPKSSFLAVCLSALTGLLQVGALILLVPVLELGFNGELGAHKGIIANLFSWLLSHLELKTAILLGLGGFAFLGVSAVILKLCTEIFLAYLRLNFESYLHLTMADALFNLRWEKSLALRSGAITNVFLADRSLFALGAQRLLLAWGALLIAGILTGSAISLIPFSGIIALTGLTMGYGILRIVSTRKMSQTKDMARAAEQFSHETSEVLDNLKYVLVSGADKVAREKMHSYFVRYKEKLLRLLLLNVFSSASLEMGVIVFISLYLGYGIVSGGAGLSQQIIFLALFYRMAPYLLASQRCYMEAKEVQYAAENWMKIYHQASEFPKLRSGVLTPSYETGLSMKEVCFSYTGNTPNILTDISWTLKPGSCLGIVGESGAGKSTILDLVTGLICPSSGSVVLDGKPLVDLDLRKWRSHIGFVPQNSPLFFGTVLENIALGDAQPSKKKARECAILASALDFINALPNGMDTEVGEGGSMLSGGQRQRIAIARALYRDPWLLILDEATSSLDEMNERTIASTIGKLKGLISLIVVTHRLSTIELADEVLFLEKGRVVGRRVGKKVESLEEQIIPPNAEL